ncbi:MAG: hypothetical protein Q4P66_08525 [Actinomycetaceae bacterium]|nr:hypothetical protein [Actinomycetaceae bacterium]
MKPTIGHTERETIATSMRGHTTESGNKWVTDPHHHNHAGAQADNTPIPYKKPHKFTPNHTSTPTHPNSHTTTNTTNNTTIPLRPAVLAPDFLP